MTTPLAERRRDLHNTSINFDLAVAGRCGFTHIPSGRVCQLPYRHPGPCKLRYLAPAATPTPAGLGQNPTDSAPVTAAEGRSLTTRNVTPHAARSRYDQPDTHPADSRSSRCQ